MAIPLGAVGQAEAYDEDIVENPFYTLMQTSRHRKLYAAAATSRWMILVPKAGSVNTGSLSVSDIEAHIYCQATSDYAGQHKLVSSSQKYVISMDGQTIKTISGFAEDRQATVLFEESFYNQSDQSFRVICISQPLSGELSVEEKAQAPLRTLDDCRQFLWGASSNRKVSRRLADTVNLFNSASDCLSGQSVRHYVDGVNTVYTRGMQGVLKDSTHRKQARSKPSYMARLKLAVETHVLTEVYGNVMPALSSLCSNEDVALNKASRNLSHVTAEDVGVSKQLVENMGPACQRMNQLNDCKSPLMKLKCLKDVVDILTAAATAAGSAIAADELLPLLLLVVIRSEIPNWTANLEFMTQFQFSGAHQDSFAYFLTTFEAVVAHIKGGGLGGTVWRARTWSTSTAASDEDGGASSRRSSMSSTSRSVAASSASGANGSPARPSSQRKEHSSSAIAKFFDAVADNNTEVVGSMLHRVMDDLVQSSPAEDTAAAPDIAAATTTTANGSPLRGNGTANGPANGAGNGPANGPATKINPDPTKLCHPLCVCAKCRNLFKERQHDPTAVTVYTRDADGFTALHVAARLGHVEMVTLLIEQGAIIDAADYNGSTPLHVACQRDMVDCALILLMHHAAINAVDNDGLTPLHMCAKYGHDRCIKVILWHSPGDLNVDAVSSRGDTALHVAARWGFTSVVDMLLQHTAKVDVRNKKNQLAIHLAHNQVIRDLLQERVANTDSARVASKPKRIQHFRQRSNSFEPADFELGATLAARPPNGIPESMRRMSASLSDRGMVQRSISNSSTPRRKAKSVRLSRETSYRRADETVKAARKELYEKDVGMLFEAIEDDDVELVKFKLGMSSQGDANKYEQERCHPLCQCDRCTRMTKTSRLTTHCQNKEGYSPLHVAALHGRFALAELLLEHSAEVQQCTHLRHSPLHFACQYNHGPIAELLLARGADIDGQDHNGNSPLHFCSANGHGDCAQILLSRGATVNLRNARGDTPLHNAARWGYKELVDLLLAGGASVNLENKRGRTPLQDAQGQAIVEVLTLIAKERVVGGSILSNEVIVQGASAPLEFINGTFRQIGELPADWYLGAMASPTQDCRPLFQRDQPIAADSPVFPGQEVYLYYYPQLKCWAISTTIGGDLLLAYAGGDVSHPAVLRSAWNVATGSGFKLDLDLDLLNGKPLRHQSPVLQRKMATERRQASAEAAASPLRPQREAAGGAAIAAILASGAGGSSQDPGAAQAAAQGAKRIPTAPEIFQALESDDRELRARLLRTISNLEQSKTLRRAPVVRDRSAPLISTEARRNFSISQFDKNRLRKTGFDEPTGVAPALARVYTIERFDPAVLKATVTADRSAPMINPAKYAGLTEAACAIDRLSNGSVGASPERSDSGGALERWSALRSLEAADSGSATPPDAPQHQD